MMGRKPLIDIHDEVAKLHGEYTKGELETEQESFGYSGEAKAKLIKWEGRSACLDDRVKNELNKEDFEAFITAMENFEPPSNEELARNMIEYWGCTQELAEEVYGVDLDE